MLACETIETVSVHGPAPTPTCTAQRICFVPRLPLPRLIYRPTIGGSDYALALNETKILKIAQDGIRILLQISQGNLVTVRAEGVFVIGKCRVLGGEQRR